MRDALPSDHEATNPLAWDVVGVDVSFDIVDISDDQDSLDVATNRSSLAVGNCVEQETTCYSGSNVDEKPINASPCSSQQCSACAKLQDSSGQPVMRREDPTISATNKRRDSIAKLPQNTR